MTSVGVFAIVPCETHDWQQRCDGPAKINNFAPTFFIQAAELDSEVCLPTFELAAHNAILNETIDPALFPQVLNDLQLVEEGFPMFQLARNLPREVVDYMQCSRDGDRAWQEVAVVPHVRTSRRRYMGT
jgi:hypothetical protein